MNWQFVKVRVLGYFFCFINLYTLAFMSCQCYSRNLFKESASDAHKATLKAVDGVRDGDELDLLSLQVLCDLVANQDGVAASGLDLLQRIRAFL